MVSLPCLGFRPDGVAVEPAIVTKSMTHAEYDAIVKKVQEHWGNKLEWYEESHIDIDHRPVSTE